MPQTCRIQQCNIIRGVLHSTIYPGPLHLGLLFFSSHRLIATLIVYPHPNQGGEGDRCVGVKSTQVDDLEKDPHTTLLYRSKTKSH